MRRQRQCPTYQARGRTTNPPPGRKGQSGPRVRGRAPRLRRSTPYGSLARAFEERGTVCVERIAEPLAFLFVLCVADENVVALAPRGVVDALENQREERVRD